MNPRVGSPRSYLYIPGDRPERLEKGFGRQADALIADLEDAVAEESKDAALDEILSWLDRNPHPEVPVWVRVNAGERREREIALLASRHALSGIFLPKAETAEEILHAAEQLAAAGSEARINPMIESATGLVNVHSIAAAPRVGQLHLGEMDLAADLGLEPDEQGSQLGYARSLVVIASRHASLPAPAAPVSANIDATDLLTADTQSLRRAGFFGRDCIHPAQVAVANRIFQPTPDELEWARRILDDATTLGGAFRAPDGSMVDEAVLRRARAVLREL